MPQQPKRPVSELKAAELRTIVGHIQRLLWLDVEEGDGPEFWNADKEWECADLLSFIATELEDHGLKPIDPPTVIGFNSVDEFIQYVAEHYVPADQRVVPYDDVGDCEEPDGYEREGGDDA